jgi:hypothetical protein
VGHLDEDAQLDVVVANFDSNDVSLLRGRGDGRFHDERRIELPASAKGPAALALADLDGDGKLAIVTANYNSNDATLLRAVNGAHFEPVRSFVVGNEPIALQAMDLDADFNVDLVAAHHVLPELTWLRGDAQASFAAAQPLSVPIAQARLPRPPTDFPAAPPDTQAVASLANMPSAFAPTARKPAVRLAPPMQRIGQSYGGATSDYKILLSAARSTYPPLITMAKAGARWVRLEGDAGYFQAGGPMTFPGMAATVDDLIARGYSVHFVVSDFRFPSSRYSADFPNATDLSRIAEFATQLVAATHHPGRVIYEIWNEPNFKDFWPERAGVDEAAMYAKLLVHVTEAIHRVTPGATVLSAGLLTYRNDDYAQRFLTAYNQLTKTHPLGLVDRFSLHPYPFLDQDTWQEFRTALDAAGFAGHFVQLTEMGGWGAPRDAIARWNANNLLRAMEEDVEYFNFWSAVSAPAVTGQDAGGFMDKATVNLEGCEGSIYAPLPDVKGFFCHASTYVLSTFNRIAGARTFQGALFDSRVTLPGKTADDPLSGVRALKFESPEDVVIAVYTADRPRGLKGSGRAYPIQFPQMPAFVLTATGGILDSTPDGRYSVSYDSGPLYFVFSKTGHPPTMTLSAKAMCADGSAPLRGQIDVSSVVWPAPDVDVNKPVPFVSAGVRPAGSAALISRQLAYFTSSIYVMAEVADGSGRVLTVKSAVQTGGGVGGPPKVSTAPQFSPPTPMARLDPPSSTSAAFDIDFLALPEWCTP